MNKVLFSSNSDEWATPQEFFNSINKEFEFDLDPCATQENHKCDKYYTIEEDGLSNKWVEKAFRESKEDNTLVVMLIPSRTDTKYFHNFIYKRAEIRFVKGRLKFGDSNNSAPFPSMLVIFRGAYV